MARLTKNYSITTIYQDELDIITGGIRIDVRLRFVENYCCVQVHIGATSVLGFRT